MNQIGPYTVIERIASGGMGEIYVAKLQREAGFEKLVAVKRILPHLAHDDGFVRMFEAEARLSALLTHRNIVQIYDFGRSGNDTYLAMEFVDGFNVRTLQDMGRKQGVPLPLSLTTRIVASAARALDYAYRREDSNGNPLKIIHRDISPQNILVSVEGEVKVADFGLAKALQIDATSLSGELKGKLNYMSPEQVRGQQLDLRADMFSLGAVLYEMLCGKRLYPNNVAIRTLIGMVERAEFRPLGQVTSSIPAPIAHIVETCLQSEANDRYESTRELVQALDSAIAELGIGEPTYTLADYVRRFDSERPLARILAHDVTMVPNRPIVSRQDDAQGELGGLPDEMTPTPKTERAMLRPQHHGPRTAISRVDTQSMLTARPQKRTILPLLAVILFSAIGLVAWLQHRNNQEDERSSADAERSVPVTVSTGIPANVPPDAGPVPEPKKSPPPTTQQLVLKDVPEGAKCIVFDVLRDLELPSQSCTKPWKVGSGPHRIFVSAAGYQNWQATVRVLSGLSQDVEVRLQAKPPGPCSLTISTKPTGANVWLDGAIQNGTAPLQLTAVSPGAHTIRVSLRGHASVEQALTCDRTTSDSLVIPLKPRSYTVGIHRASRDLREGATWTQDVRIGGLKATVRVDVRTKFASVTLNTKPFSKVGVGKRDLGVVPVKFRVPLGAKRRVRLFRDTLVGTVMIRFDEASGSTQPLP